MCIFSDHVKSTCKFCLKNPYRIEGGVAHTGQAVRCTTIAVSLTISTSKKDIALCLCRGLFHKALYTRCSIKRIFFVKYRCRALCLKSRRRASIMLKAMLYDAMSLLNVMKNLHVFHVGIKYIVRHKLGIAQIVS